MNMKTLIIEAARARWIEFRACPSWVQIVYWLTLGVALGAIEWLASGTFM